MWTFNDQQVLCPHCGNPMDPSILNQDEFLPCTNCTTLVRIELFPAFFEQEEERVPSGEAALDGEAVCFNHSENRAEVACELCGRFICSLCRLEISGDEICPVCFEREDETGPSQKNDRFLYDRLALFLAIVPLLCFWYVVPVTAPASLYIALAYRNEPGQVGVSFRWRNVVAIVLSGLQVLGCIWALWYIF